MNLSQLLLVAISWSMVTCRVVQHWQTGGSCDCSDTRSPVCGVDQKTYSNMCQAKCKGVEVDCTGECICVGGTYRGGRMVGTAGSGGCGPLVTRINVMDISPYDFEKYNNALTRVKSFQNASSFEEIGGYHGKPFFCNYNQTGPPGVGSDENGCCINHWQQDDRLDLFTPWHRLFTYQMEKSLKIASSHDGSPLGMPYWDWTNPNTQIGSSPDAIPFFASQGPWKNGPMKGTPNITRRGPNPNYNYKVLRQMTKTAYKQKTFCDFNHQVVMPHNLIHLHVGSCPANFWQYHYSTQGQKCNEVLFGSGDGFNVPKQTGDMASNYWASYDPIFYLHHAYVDHQYAFFQELQALRKKSIKFKEPGFRMQPFNRKSNPYEASRLNNNGKETEDYKQNFCYKFDSLTFNGMTPEQFETMDKEERKSASLYAGVLLKSTGITSYLQFDLLSLGSVRYHRIGSVATLGTPDKIPDYSEPKTKHMFLYEVTDSLNNPDREVMDKTVTFDMANYVDVSNKDLDIKQTYKPVVVFRAANSDELVLRLHEDHIHLYPPQMHLSPGLKVEFLKADGSHSSNVWCCYNPGGCPEYSTQTIHVTGVVNIQHQENTFYLPHPTDRDAPAVEVTLGYSLDCLIQCGADGSPTSLDDELMVIPWRFMPTNKRINIFSMQKAIIAWCRGAKVNIVQFGNKNDFENCNIKSNETAPWVDNEHQRGFMINTLPTGPQYFANGVGDNCSNGWKVEVYVGQQ